jgi:hypothetical protein
LHTVLVVVPYVTVPAVILLAPLVLLLLKRPYVMPATRKDTAAIDPTKPVPISSRFLVDRVVFFLLAGLCPDGPASWPIASASDRICQAALR